MVPYESWQRSFEPDQEGTTLQSSNFAGTKQGSCLEAMQNFRKFYPRVCVIWPVKELCPLATGKKSLNLAMTSWPVSMNILLGSVSRSEAGGSPLILNLMNSYWIKAEWLNCCHRNQVLVGTETILMNRHFIKRPPFLLGFNFSSFSSQKRQTILTAYCETLWKIFQCDFLRSVEPK